MIFISLQQLRVLLLAEPIPAVLRTTRRNWSIVPTASGSGLNAAFPDFF
jgi:hypothetical protein